MSDSAGSSPFWEAVGRHFFEVDFPAADYQSILDKKFIAELMPLHPIYVPLLPVDVQGVIGQVHEKTAPALSILEQEGFQKTNRVDIFDAGPLVSCPLKDIRTVQASVKMTVARSISRDGENPNAIVCTSGDVFRSCYGKVEVWEDGVALDQEAAQSIGVDVGMTIRYVKLKS